MSRPTEIAPGIWEVETFFSDVECYELIASMDGREWGRAHVARFSDGHGYKEAFRPDVRLASALDKESAPAECWDFEARIAEICIPAANSIWHLDGLEISGTQLVKYGLGGKFDLHRDWGRSFPRRIVSVVAYLNSSYRGGKLVFPEIDFTYEPRRGSCVIFPSQYLHASTPIDEGEKLAFVSFLCGKPPA